MGRRTASFSAALAVLLAAAAPLRAEGPIVVPRTWPDDWPMDPAPITGARWPELPPPLPPVEPATPAAERVVALLERILRTQQDARYQHRTDVRERVHRYRWDCSGMVSWIVRRAAPRAGRAIGQQRTSARGIYRLITRSRGGWHQLDHIEDVRPGDVFAWRTPPGSPSRHTGHTGFALERARPVSGLRDAYALRIADSVVGPHQDDTRPNDDTEGGLGTGVFVFLTDGDGHATHYGWHGTRTAGYMRTPVVFGRLIR